MKMLRRVVSMTIAVLMTLSLAPCLAQTAEADRAAEIVAGMSFCEKVAQLLFMDVRNWMTLNEDEARARRKADPDYNGESVTQMNGEIAALLAEYQFGGVILFGENLGETAASVRLVRDIQRAATSEGGLPLFIGTDQEGGSVTRLGQGTYLPGNMAIGATGSAEYAHAAGAITGGECAAIGINVNFSPDADVNDNPQNPIINLRSFGSDPDAVAELAVSMTEGIESAGVIAVGKHFPGHGNTATDSHTSLPVVDKDLDALRETELKPFQALIDSGAQMIMCAHIQFPEVDSTTIVAKDGRKIVVPATFSNKILTDLLRGEMGYRGVIITDAMGMGAIADNVEPAEGAVLALEAGADMVLMPVEVRCPADAAKLEDVFQAVADAVENGELAMERIDESATRVVRMKLQNGILDEMFDASGDAAAVQNALSIVGCDAHREMERTIAEAAVTLTRDEMSALPLRPGDGETVLILAPSESIAASARFGFQRLKVEGVIAEGAIFRTYSYENKRKIGSAILKALKDADYVVLLTEMKGASSLAAGQWRTALPTAVREYMRDAGREGAFIRASVGAPFDAANYLDCPAELFCYGSLGMSDEDAASGAITGKYGPNIPALMGAIFGGFAPAGRVPVKLD